MSSLEIYYGPVSSDHLETSFNGLMDMISGNESYSSRYLIGLCIHLI